MDERVNMDNPPDSAHDLDELEEPSGDEMQNPHIAQVFNTPLLLEMILDYGLRDNEFQSETLNRQDLLDFRKVSKSWKEAVSKVLKRNAEPLYIVTMPTDNDSLSGIPNLENNKKEMNNFVRFLASREPEHVYKGFALIAYTKFFRLESYDLLLTCLRQAEHLVKMDLKIPSNGGSLPGLFPNTIVSLPALRKMTLDLTDYEPNNLSESETVNLSPDNLTLLLQSLLSKSWNLKILSIEGHIPSSFQFMELPASLTDLALEQSENTGPELFWCLISNHLPELKRLRMMHLFHKKAQLAGDLLTQILLKFSKTLRSLEVEETFAYEPPRTPVTLCFPVMENLQKLKIWGMHFESETGIPPLLARFPKMKSLTLHCHTEQMFRKWTVGAPPPAPLVNTFRLELCDEQKAEAWNMIPISPDVVISIHATFPNITDLNFPQLGRQFAGLQCVFKKMRQLKRLTIVVKRSEEKVTSDHWDSALIGVPLEVVTDLAGCSSNSEKSVKLTEVEGNLPSIRNLSELAYFKVNDVPRFSEMVPLISNLAFIYAFNGMSKLTHVEVFGRLALAKEIEDDWKKQDRTIEYVPML